MKPNLESLESTLMELGTELFLVKSQMNSISRKNVELLRLVHSVQLVLEERGLVTREDLEEAMEDINLVCGSDYIEDGEALKQLSPDSKKTTH